MTSLSSQTTQQLSMSSISHSIPMLSASGHNFPEWLKEILIYADTHHGKVGQDIRHETSSPLLNPDPGTPTASLPEPNYFSPRIHPRTGQPIPDTRLSRQHNCSGMYDHNWEKEDHHLDHYDPWLQNSQQDHFHRIDITQRRYGLTFSTTELLKDVWI